MVYLLILHFPKPLRKYRSVDAQLGINLIKSESLEEKPQYLHL